MDDELFERVDRLLHDAEQADGGARMARAMQDTESANRMTAKARALRAEAEVLDPEHRAHAWAEADEVAASNAEADRSFADWMAKRTNQA